MTIKLDSLAMKTQVDLMYKQELEDLQEVIKKRLKVFRPLRIKKVYKTCGSKNCTCRNGPREQYAHGPYVYVTYSQYGRQYKLTLGNFHTVAEIAYLRRQDPPKWYNEKYVIPHSKWQKMDETELKKSVRRTLWRDEFIDFYGLSLEEDRIGRPESLRYKQELYAKDMAKYKEVQETVWSKVATKYGIGNPNGYQILVNLLVEGHYIVDN